MSATLLTLTSVRPPSVVAPPPPPPPPCAGNAVHAVPFHVSTSLAFGDPVIEIGPPNSTISPESVPPVIAPEAVILPVIIPPVAPLILSTVVACPYNFLA